MPQPDHVTALEIEDRNNLDFVTNIIQAYSFDNAKLATFADFFADLMGGESGLSALEREMIAVVVSSHRLMPSISTAKLPSIWFVVNGIVSKPAGRRAE